MSHEDCDHVSERIVIRPNDEVLAARAALDEAVAALDAISPEYPPGVTNYPTVDPVWLAYVHQSTRVNLAKGDLHRAVRAHYTELTEIGTSERGGRSAAVQPPPGAGAPGPEAGA